jgi:hypothetical protein
MQGLSEMELHADLNLEAIYSRISLERVSNLWPVLVAHVACGMIRGHDDHR